MSDGVFIPFVCQVFNLMVVYIKVCQRFVCVVFVPVAPTWITWSLTSLYDPCLFRLAISMLCCAFAFWSWGSGLVFSQILNSIR